MVADFIDKINQREALAELKETIGEAVNVELGRNAGYLSLEVEQYPLYATISADLYYIKKPNYIDGYIENYYIKGAEAQNIGVSIMLDDDYIDECEKNGEDVAFTDDMLINAELDLEDFIAKLADNYYEY